MCATHDSSRNPADNKSGYRIEYAVPDGEATILDNLPEGYVEVMRWGMITFEVPIDDFIAGYEAARAQR